MVEKAITDGPRIAELLASELEGLAVGPLSTVTPVGAEPDATPSQSGTYAYAIEFGGDRIGEVRIRPASAVLAVDGDRIEFEPADSGGISVAEDTIVIERGAAVKRAVDLLRHRLAD